MGQATDDSIAGFELLGTPDPGLPAAYRGTSREVPLVLEDLGLDHPANQALLAYLLSGGGDGRIAHLATALRLQQAYSTYPIFGRFEVVEITAGTTRPQAGTIPLGFDVAFAGGIESLLASLLLWEDPFDSRERTDPRVLDLRHRFADRLNVNLLFASDADAQAFLTAAERVGPWEGPEIKWAVLGLWALNDGEIARPLV